MHRLLLPIALMTLVLSAATPLRAQTPGALPQGDGRDLAATACSQCHNLNVLMAGRDGPVGWKNHVYTWSCAARN
jgi:mono/diheme cytochrome c family protein